MTPSRRSLVLPLALAAAIGVSACGTESDSAGSDATSTDPEVALVEEDGPDDDHDDDDDDHDDDDHDDDDHDDDDHDDDDHDDDDHDDDDHDDDDDDHESGGLDAHEHGTADMSIAWIDAEVAIDLISPTFNVFGFEYEPTTDEDLAIEADRTAALSAAGIVTINDEAGCTLVDPVETDVEREGSHSEITVSWRFSCDDPDAIEQVDASELFAEFPNFEDVDVQWISDSDQSAAELSPSSTTLSLRR